MTLDWVIHDAQAWDRDVAPFWPAGTIRKLAINEQVSLGYGDARRLFLNSIPEVGLQIWVDADACPAVVKQILFRASKRTGMAVTLVANQPLQVPRLPQISAIQVSSGFDVADNEIVRLMEAGDLVITADIPLAAEVIEEGGQALSPRGEMYSADDIAARLTMRDFMDTLRASGIHGGGPSALGERERQAFANALDRWLARVKR